MDDTTLPTWITVKEAAARLRVHKMTVYRMIQHGSIPAIRFRRNFRIDQRDLDNYIQNSRVVTGTPPP